jgi:prolyl-tRNA synthetase
MTKIPDITTNFSEWYHHVVYEAELADQAPVRGCMVVRPYGCALWEQMQSVLDAQFKATGHQNAAFPMLIPMSFLQKEKEHVAGFSPELAVVTHAGGKKLEEELVIRPTSETIIHHMFAQWIRSWRDLPMKINQWCSVIRWEMRPRPFLRTTEFWWQEGHTAHETAQEALEEAELMHRIYRDFMQDYLAIPVVAEIKPEHEKFAGGDRTYTLEGMTLDGRALQMGTSHLISQNFAKAFNMVFQDREGGLSYPHLTSWGVSTRMIGGLIMTHGDAKGLIMPPRIAPIQIVIIPIFKAENRDPIMRVAHELKTQLGMTYRVHLDADEQETPGAKFYRWELKGVPVRIEIGPRDLQNESVTIVNRVTGEKTPCAYGQIPHSMPLILDKIQKELYERALRNRAEKWFVTDASLSEVGEMLQEKPGFYQVGWSKEPKTPDLLKAYGATIRCILPERKSTRCFHTGAESVCDIIVAKAY